MSDEVTEIYVDRVIKATKKALLCEIDEVEYWLPRSQIVSSEVDIEDDYGTIEIPSWLAKRKGLI